MRCPGCDADQPLTWSRYLRAPLGRHVCSACGIPFRPRTTWRFYLVVVLAWLLVLALSLWAMRALGLGLGPTLALYFAIGFGVLLPIDRWLDDRVRACVRRDGR